MILVTIQKTAARQKKMKMVSSGMDRFGACWVKASKFLADPPFKKSCTACAGGGCIFRAVKLGKSFPCNYLRRQNIFSTKCDLCDQHSDKKRWDVV